MRQSRVLRHKWGQMAQTLAQVTQQGGAFTANPQPNLK